MVCSSTFLKTSFILLLGLAVTGHDLGLVSFDLKKAFVTVPPLFWFKGARTYCIINEATPSGVYAMDYFS